MRPDCSVRRSRVCASTGSAVLVTNGVYDTGGKVMGGDLANRVAVDKQIAVVSVNGPEVTLIQGAWHPGPTNGPTAVRCAWLAQATMRGWFRRSERPSVSFPS